MKIKDEEYLRNIINSCAKKSNCRKCKFGSWSGIDWNWRWCEHPYDSRAKYKSEVNHDGYCILFEQRKLFGFIPF